MPLFSGVEFLHDSVSSIIQQTHNDWELLIGINGHHVETCNYIKNEINKYNDERIRCFVVDEVGKSNALNYLLNYTTSNYVALIDVDDKWKSDKLERQIPYIIKYDVVGTNAEYFGEKTGEPGLFFGKLTKQMFSWQNPIINSSVVFKREDAYWDLDFEGIDDYNLWIELLKKGKSFYNLPETLTLHRVYKSSFFNTKNSNAAEQLLRKKLPWLTNEEIRVLEKIKDKKAWDL